MKKPTKVQKTRFSILGNLLFLLTIIIVSSTSILLYSYLESQEKSQGIIAAITLSYIIILTIIVTLIDFFRRKFTIEKPIKKIVEATNQVMEGDFNVIIPIEHRYDHYDEYDIICENFNAMVKELSSTEVLRNDFIANVSHEIKTPLSVISNYAESIEEGNFNNEKLIDYANGLKITVKKLSDLINNILKLNKLENQKLNPKNIRFDLAEQLRECVLNYDTPAELKNIELICDDIEELTITSDNDLLEIVWNNLLSNAIKFTPSNGKVSVSLTSNHKFAVVSVKDTGLGITQEVGERIFDKFYQGDPSRTQEGNGLGLTLVKKVIDLIGGEITVESTPTKGSTFTVKIKL